MDARHLSIYTPNIGRISYEPGGAARCYVARSQAYHCWQVMVSAFRTTVWLIIVLFCVALGGSLFFGVAAAQPANSGCISVQATPSAGFLNWLQNGGAERAGLPRESLEPLRSATSTLLNGVAKLCPGVEQISRDWWNLAGQGNAALIAGSSALVGRLGELNTQSNTTRDSAAESKSQVIQALTMVNKRIDGDQGRIKTLNAEIVKTDRRMAQAESELWSAQAQLDGSRGFLNGFLTGITFGIHNPVKENIDRANRSIDTINEQRRSLDEQRRAIQAAHEELQAKRELIQILASMDRTITDFQNSVNAAHKSLSAARDHLASSGNTQTQGASLVFLRRAGTDMENLSDWIRKFNAVVQRFAVRPGDSDASRALTTAA